MEPTLPPGPDGRYALSRTLDRPRRRAAGPPDPSSSVRTVDELVEIRRSRRAQRWTLIVPWGGPAVLTVPSSMDAHQVERVLAAQHDWIARERAAQVPRLRLDARAVSEDDARRAARELVAMVADEEASALGVSYRRIEIRDQRTRWGSCSPRGTLSFSWRLALAPFDVLDYVVVHELCHLRELNHSQRFWRLVASRRPGWRRQRNWLREHGPELLAFQPGE
jgi:predicted metal-dependent hydrolase